MHPRLQPIAAATAAALSRTFTTLAGARGAIVVVALVGAAGYYLYRNPPVRSVRQGEAGLRENRFTGEITQWRDGSVLVLPLVHELRIVSLRDRIYRPEKMSRAAGPSPLQSQEGLSLGV